MISKEVIKDFPVLQNIYNNKRLVFLDSAASSQKPSAVINCVKEYYENYYANIHRGLYRNSIESTKKFENARKIVQEFINAKSEQEIIFVKGGTEAINLVAYAYGEELLKAGDEVILSELEHHANIVPWQVLRDKIGIKIKYIPMNSNGDIDIENYQSLLTDKTKFVSLTHVSNALGTVLPVKEMISYARQCGAKVLIDGCQSIPHMQVDVQDLDADFYVFSGHKIYAPSGIGVLYGKKELLNEMTPYQTGGEMIASVTKEKTIYNSLPYKFEAGTPPIAQAIGLGKALQYVTSLGMNNIHEHETNLIKYALDKLNSIDFVHVYSNAKQVSGAISFNIGNIHAHDIGTFMDNDNIALRVGHHCAQPTINKLGVSSTVRVSFGVYNNIDDINVLCKSIEKANLFFSKAYG